MANKPLPLYSSDCQLAEYNIMHLDNGQHNTTKSSTQSNIEPNQGSSSGPVTWLSLPHKTQLIILALCRLSEPLSNTCLLPYLYSLILSLQPSSDSSPASISRLAGLLVSLFALSQFFTSVLWAHIADRLGRKPVILVGLVLSIVSNVGFGFSKSIPAVMCWRVLAGIANGNIGVMRTMTAEIVKEKKYQSRAFLMLPLVFNSGNVVGLALGGFLADPVSNLPWFFGSRGVLNIDHDPEGIAWMRAFPYALPTLFNAAVLTGCLFLAICGLKETVIGDPGRKGYGLVLGRIMRRLSNRSKWPSWRTGYTAVDSQDRYDGEDVLAESPYWCKPVIAPEISPPKISITSREIWTRGVLHTLISFAILPLHNAAFMQVFPVFLSTPASDTQLSSLFEFAGGLGLPSATIGLFLSAFGVLGILTQLIIYPSILGRLGTLWSYRLALSIFPFAYILTPYISTIPTSIPAAQGIGIALILFLQVTARTFAIPSSVILLTNSSPTPSALGAIHGVGNMLSSLSRALGPALGGLVFGLGMDIGIVGLAWWGYLTVFSLVGLAWSFTLREEGSAAKGLEKDLELSDFISRDQRRVRCIK